jgi:hypothetical protein
MYEPTQNEVKRKMIETDARNDVPKSLRISRAKICGAMNFNSSEKCFLENRRLSFVVGRSQKLQAVGE